MSSVVRPQDIGAVVAKKDFTAAVCSYCNESFQREHGAVAVQVTWKDLKGKWQQSRYCTPCAKLLGELDDERAQQAIRQADRSGI